MLRYLALSFCLLLVACGTLPPERVIELTVTADGYDQTRLEAQAGGMLTLRLRNRDTIAHSLTLELPTGDRTISVEPMVDVLLSVPIRQPGSYRFYCGVPGHTEEGILVVSE
ncbi:MAG: cupredoxin domain-containing protein [Oscillochloridaceae bacterium umkhey_bin13]